MRPFNFNKGKIFIILFIVILAISFMGHGYSAAQETKRITWPEFKELINVFLNNPSKDNAEIILGFLPAQRNNIDKREWKEDLLEYCVMRGDCSWILTYEIFSGNIYAARIARRLLNISDGAATEELCDTFGRLIRINPKLFLEIFYENYDPVFLECAVLMSMFWDGQERYRRYNYIRRIESLRTVTDPELKGIRDHCITILERELR